MAESKRIKLEVEEEPGEASGGLQVPGLLTIKQEEVDFKFEEVCAGPSGIKSEIIETEGEGVPSSTNSCQTEDLPMSQSACINKKKLTKTSSLPDDVDYEEESDTESDSDDEDLDQDQEEVQKVLEKFRRFQAYIQAKGDKSSDEDVGDETENPYFNKIFQFKVTLLGGIAPQVWRQIQVPANYTFHQFHIAIQRAMGWQSIRYDYHLHQFRLIHPKHGFDIQIGLKFDEVKDERKIKLFQYVGKKMNERFIYEYDLGFGWEHEILLEKVCPRNGQDKYPKCLDGKRACPPEDVGGLGLGYEEFCKAVNDKEHPEHENMTEWLGRDEFDPDKFDPKSVFGAQSEALSTEEIPDSD